MTRITRHYEVLSFWELTSREQDRFVQIVSHDDNVFSEYDAVAMDYYGFEDYFYSIIADNIHFIYEISNDGTDESLEYVGYEIPTLHIRCYD